MKTILNKVTGGETGNGNCPNNLEEMNTTNCTVCGFKVFQHEDGNYRYYTCPYVNGTIGIISKFNPIAK